MNVLITCAGRRTSLVRAFQQVVSEGDGTVVAADVDAMAPTLRQADDGVVLPPVDDSSYPDALLECVRSHDIRLVVPTIDPELPVLAAAKCPLHDEGAHPLIAEGSFLRLASDKLITLRRFGERGIRTPRTWRPSGDTDADWPDPCFVKPRYGSAGADARCVPAEYTDAALARTEAPIIQEAVDAPEITVDALFDLQEGQLLHYVPRRRLRTEAGKSIQGRTIGGRSLQGWLEGLLRVAGTLGARGPITVQAFLTHPEPTLSEINPRFGGGFPLSRAAGARYPEWILRLLNGTSVSPRLGEYEEGLCMARYYDELFFSPSS